MLSIASTSRIRGTLRTSTSSSVRIAEARIGRAPFLFPAGTIVPESGAPPSMTNFSMSCVRDRRPRTGSVAWRLASVTAMSPPSSPRPAPPLPAAAHPSPAVHPRRPPATAACRSPGPQTALPSHFSHAHADTHTCSPPIRPSSHLSYEHMFPRPRTFKPARHALGAVRLIRSFLLLEDDYDVDWEVDRDEQPPAAHPHRTQLRGRGAAAPRRRG